VCAVDAAGQEKATVRLNDSGTSARSEAGADLGNRFSNNPYVDVADAGRVDDTTLLISSPGEACAAAPGAGGIQAANTAQP